MSYKITTTENGDGTVTVRYQGDAQALVDHCADYAKSFRDGTRSKNGWGIGARKALSIDPVLAMKVAQERGMDYFDPALWEIFKDRDYAKLRCIDDKLLFRGKGRKIIVGA